MIASRWFWTAAIAAIGFLSPARHGQTAPITTATDAQLRHWLKQYPEADANGDGRLTVPEAEAYRQKLQRGQSGQTGKGQPKKPSFSFQHEFRFVGVSDGVRIAVAVGYPRGFDAAAPARKWPTVFSTCGYVGATRPIGPDQYGDRFVTVNASVRGTGASGGTLDPWASRTWQDGYEIIEDWVVKQPWSNGKVGIVGHSWPGLMGFLVASTAPPSVKAVCVSGLIDDFYRGISRPGGVPNSGFPVNWLNSYYRADGPFGSGAAAKLVREMTDPEYSALVSRRPSRDLADDLLWLLLHEPFDGAGWKRRSLCTHAAKIRAPILIAHAYQDEQTGPTGWRLWNRISEDVPKRLILTNGPHQVTNVSGPDVGRWLQHWLLDEGDGTVADPEQRVQCYFTTLKAPSGQGTRQAKPLASPVFPFADTEWTRLHLRAGGRLMKTPAATAEESGTYRVEVGDTLDGKQRIDYRFVVREPLAICGPITLTLWASLTTLDTDFFVLLGDEDWDGRVWGLQRGILRASHRELDVAGSDYANVTGEEVLIRPRHRHRKAAPVAPHAPHEFQISIPAVGHVFLPGHTLVLRISRPPAGDPVGVTKWGGASYRYASDQPPGTVTILHDPAHPSSLLLPVLPKLPPTPEKRWDPEAVWGLQLAE